MLFPFSQVFEVICLIVAFRYLGAVKHSFWGSFRWFMVITVAVETVGLVLRENALAVNKAASNHWLYNLYMPVETLFKYYVLYMLCRDYFRVERWLIPFLVLFAGFYLFESFQSGFQAYSYMANSLMSVSIIVICCLYFYYFLKKEEYVNIYEHAPFWIITSLFFFYLGSTACNIFFKYLANIYTTYNIPIRYYIFGFLNFIMYGSWSYSFICKYRQTISSS